jgi:ketosteroid isomerase-like protein
MVVLEGADTALVLMESTLDAVDKAGADVSTVRRATYVFRKSEDGRGCARSTIPTGPIF